MTYFFFASNDSESVVNASKLRGELCEFNDETEEDERERESSSPCLRTLSMKSYAKSQCRWSTKLSCTPRT